MKIKPPLNHNFEKENKLILLETDAEDVGFQKVKDKDKLAAER